MLDTNDVKLKTHYLRIERDLCNVDCTLGRLTLSNIETNDVLFTCHTLERPGPDTTESGLRLRIPEGTYSMKWQTRTGLKGVAPHLPVPWLFSEVVPDTRYIYIHNGNYPSNTDGCLLVGTGRYGNMVTSSVVALNGLKLALKDIDLDCIIVDVINSFGIKPKETE